MLHGGLHPFGVRGDIFEDFAKALGTTPDKLKEPGEQGAPDIVLQDHVMG